VVIDDLLIVTPSVGWLSVTQKRDDEPLDLLTNAVRQKGSSNHRSGSHEVPARWQRDRRSDLLGHPCGGGQLLM